MLVDNQIRSAPGAAGPAVRFNPLTGLGTDFTSLGNQFTVSNPIEVGGSGLRRWSIDDTIVNSSSISSTVPALPPTPARLSTNIFEVPAGSNGAAIQSAINSAAALAGKHPVVHLPKGNYSIGQTITVPAGLDVVIVGDGPRTSLNWTAGTSGSVFTLKGPSVAQVVDIGFHGSRLAEDVTIENADQPGATVSVLAPYVQENTTNEVFADRLAYTKTNFLGRTSTGKDRCLFAWRVHPRGAGSPSSVSYGDARALPQRLASWRRFKTVAGCSSWITGTNRDSDRPP